MRNVVAFLLENFPDIQHCPQGQDLGEMLESAGFMDDDIGDAITIMQLLQDTPPSNEGQPESQALRVYHDEEAEILSAEIRGLLHFLYTSQAINFAQREFVIHALMHLSYDEMTLDNAKVLALLVSWAHRSEMPVLIGDELMVALHGKSLKQ
ncbi:DUF494 family protein [Neisseriaceae bacterium B1]